MKRLIGILLCVLLGACVSPAFTLVGNGGTRVRDALEVQGDSSWNRFQPPLSPRMEIWTRHGLGLDTVHFIAGLPDGRGIEGKEQTSEGQHRVFRAGMSPEEVVGWVEHLLVGSGGSFTLERLEPATVDGVRGFRFDYTLVNRQEELERRGFGQGAIKDGKLYLLLFQAPKGRYFDRAQAQVRAMADSMKILSPAKG